MKIWIQRIVMWLFFTWWIIPISFIAFIIESLIEMEWAENWGFFKEMIPMYLWIEKDEKL